MMDSADPLEGWSIDDILQSATPAKHDMYGSLFHLLTSTLSKFCHRISDLDVYFKLVCVDAKNLQAMKLVNKSQFDRVEGRSANSSRRSRTSKDDPATDS